jgi:hypothetical protein
VWTFSELSQRLVTNRALFANIARDESADPFAGTANEMTTLARFAVVDFLFFATGIAGSFHDVVC